MRGGTAEAPIRRPVLLLFLNDCSAPSRADYIAKVVLGPGGGGGATARVANVMTPAAAGPNSADAQLIGSPETRVLQALRIMGEKGIRLLPVMDGKKLLGFLTYFDLVRVVAGRWADRARAWSAALSYQSWAPPPLCSSARGGALTVPFRRRARQVDATVAESSDEIERLVCYIGGARCAPLLRRRCCGGWQCRHGPEGKIVSHTLPSFEHAATPSWRPAGHDYAVGCQREGKIDPSIMSPPDAQPNFRPA